MEDVEEVGAEWTQSLIHPCSSSCCCAHHFSRTTDFGSKGPLALVFCGSALTSCDYHSALLLHSTVQAHSRLRLLSTCFSLIAVQFRKDHVKVQRTDSLERAPFTSSLSFRTLDSVVLPSKPLIHCLAFVPASIADRSICGAAVGRVSHRLPRVHGLRPCGQRPRMHFRAALELPSLLSWSEARLVYPSVESDPYAVLATSINVYPYVVNGQRLIKFSER